MSLPKTVSELTYLQLKTNVEEFLKCFAAVSSKDAMETFSHKLVTEPCDKLISSDLTPLDFLKEILEQVHSYCNSHDYVWPRFGIGWGRFCLNFLQAAAFEPDNAEKLSELFLPFFKHALKYVDDLELFYDILFTFVNILFKVNCSFEKAAFVIKSYVSVLRNIDRFKLFQFAFKKPDYIQKLSNLITTYGDFELQMDILEMVLLHVLNDNEILEEHWFPQLSDDINKFFLNLSFVDIELDGRKFLNVVNEFPGKVRQVCSINSCHVGLGGHRLAAPFSCGSSLGIWMDVNVESERLGITCADYLSQNDMHRTIYINCEDVKDLKKTKLTTNEFCLSFRVDNLKGLCSLAETNEVACIMLDSENNFDRFYQNLRTSSLKYEASNCNANNKADHKKNSEDVSFKAIMPRKKRKAGCYPTKSKNAKLSPSKKTSVNAYMPLKIRKECNRGLKKINAARNMKYGELEDGKKRYLNVQKSGRLININLDNENLKANRFVESSKYEAKITGPAQAPSSCIVNIATETLNAVKSSPEKPVQELTTASDHQEDRIPVIETDHAGRGKTALASPSLFSASLRENTGNLLAPFKTDAAEVKEMTKTPDRRMCQEIEKKLFGQGVCPPEKLKPSSEMCVLSPILSLHGLISTSDDPKLRFRKSLSLEFSDNINEQLGDDCNIKRRMSLSSGSSCSSYEYKHIGLLPETPLNFEEDPREEILGKCLMKKMERYKRLSDKVAEAMKTFPVLLDKQLEINYEKFDSFSANMERLLSVIESTVSDLNDLKRYHQKRTLFYLELKAVNSMESETEEAILNFRQCLQEFCAPRMSQTQEGLARIGSALLWELNRINHRNARNILVEKCQVYFQSE